MSTKIKLLLDECVQGPLVEEIKACPGISSIENIDARHLIGNRHVSDVDVMAYATKHDRILITVEGRLNEKNFPICTHPGIIVLASTLQIAKAQLFKRMMQSGERNKCYHAVTHLKMPNPIRYERVSPSEIRKVLLRL